MCQITSQAGEVLEQTHRLQVTMSCIPPGLTRLLSPGCCPAHHCRGPEQADWAAGGGRGVEVPRPWQPSPHHSLVQECREPRRGGETESSHIFHLDIPIIPRSGVTAPV